MTTDLQPFTREPRYIVVKVKDAELALTQTECDILRSVAIKVEQWRMNHGKTNLSGVFVEHDWPEHELVWKMIEQRTTGAAATPAETLVWPKLECVHDWVQTIESTHQTCIYCKKSEALDAHRR